jgi:hypothetical protein
MTESTAPPIRSNSPKPRLIQLETDCFCECGYNLHGQIVTRDPRLNFMVCQCPECGRWHPAGHAVTSWNLWQSRLGMTILVLWILFFLTALAAWFGLYCLLDEAFMDWQRREAYGYGWVPADLILLFGSTALASVILGIAVASAMWHRSRSTHLTFLQVHLSAAIFVTMMEKLDRSPSSPPDYVVIFLMLFVIGQMVVVAFGLAVGRSVSRVIVRALIPPRVLPHFGFLWQVDGKVPPALPKGSAA